MNAKVWIVPAERLKIKDQGPHELPLAARCLEILTVLRELSDAGEYVFPGPTPKEPFSGEESTPCLTACLVNSGIPKPKEEYPEGREIVPHGFRSTFRDWCEEKTNFPRSVIERALTHAVKDPTEGSYLRSSFSIPTLRRTVPRRGPRRPRATRHRRQPASPAPRPRSRCRARRRRPRRPPAGRRSPAGRRRPQDPGDRRVAQPLVSPSVQSRNRSPACGGNTHESTGSRGSRPRHRVTMLRAGWTSASCGVSSPRDTSSATSEWSVLTWVSRPSTTR